MRVGVGRGAPRRKKAGRACERCLRAVGAHLRGAPLRALRAHPRSASSGAAALTPQRGATWVPQSQKRRRRRSARARRAPPACLAAACQRGGTRGAGMLSFGAASCRSLPADRGGRARRLAAPSFSAPSGSCGPTRSCCTSAGARRRTGAAVGRCAAGAMRAALTCGFALSALAQAIGRQGEARRGAVGRRGRGRAADVAHESGAAGGARGRASRGGRPRCRAGGPAAAQPAAPRHAPRHVAVRATRRAGAPQRCRAGRGAAGSSPVAGSRGASSRPRRAGRWRSWA